MAFAVRYSESALNLVPDFNYLLAMAVGQLLGRLRQENHLNLGVGGCSEPRCCLCTPAWAKREKLHLKY
ncbi:hypothetical protein AAY473_010410 [Plecturocebus cupreus]